MKKIIGILFLSYFFISCTDQVKKVTESDAFIKESVNTTMTNWHKAATDANFENYFSKMDSAAIFIGTDASENWTKKQFKAFCKPYFEEGKAWDFKTLERTIYISKNKDIVWFNELLNTWMGTCRGSGVLEKVENNWKIKQYVLSVSIPNDNMNQVIEVKKEKDTLFLQKFTNN
jgi:hypothetical protein